ncbi:MAG: hypothetical protein ACXWQ6_08565 [Candidatus Limnocylindrales bacterium]
MTDIGSGIGGAIGGLTSGLGRALGSVVDGLAGVLQGALHTVAGAGPLAIGLIGLVLLVGLVLVARR